MKIFIKGEFRLTLIELDTNMYMVNNPEPHTLIEEKKYRDMFYWNGVYPQINKADFENMMEEWEERTLRGY